jgi:hypothetical protein
VGESAQAGAAIWSGPLSWRTTVVGETRQSRDRLLTAAQRSAAMTAPAQTASSHGSKSAPAGRLRMWLSCPGEGRLNRVSRMWSTGSAIVTFVEVAVQ